MYRKTLDESFLYNVATLILQEEVGESKWRSRNEFRLTQTQLMHSFLLAINRNVLESLIQGDLCFKSTHDHKVQAALDADRHDVPNQIAGIYVIGLTKNDFGQKL
ncbi:hypothetical protein BT63DRAFT_426944 [Microthyrium microscopicum]|uniref:Uncharacterized protein n=1 Tax=Microthyrium microscopicum TaxID=703497 RepID=A0A6A6U946_9PEZI|nr:hypothetical protein BT63DRAFT_426944 [Microthyrium microscopicum]